MGTEKTSMNTSVLETLKVSQPLFCGLQLTIQLGSMWPSLGFVTGFAGIPGCFSLFSGT